MKPSVLITGACGGIGAALCDVFGEAGFLVVGIDRTIGKEFAHKYIQCDVSQLAHSEKIAEELRREVLALTDNRLDVLINNAAIQILKPSTELTRSDWSGTLDTNLLAPFWLTTLFVPELREVRGSVINIGSIHAQLTKRNFVAYATSKGALATMTKALALDLAPDVRVNAIAPAATDTKMLREGFFDSPKGYQTLKSYHPLGRIATTKEVARAALYLSAADAHFITGTTINIDGGISACLHDPGA
jgi:NAD(P)-dependent dehydrogenase (short-subunit alcohol dehydrogenase family)